MIQLIRHQGSKGFGALALGDVPGNFRRADAAAFSVLDGRHGQRNVNKAAVFALPNGLIPVDAFAAPDPRKLGRLVGTVRWNQYRDRLADDLLRGITVELLGSTVPTGDDTVEVLADDRILREVDDRGEPRPHLFLTLALGDVDK